MAGFMGGSAWAMARDIAEGHVLVTDRVFARMSGAELEKLSFELTRRLREVRGEQPGLDDQQALQMRNRRIGRLKSALTVLRAFRARRKGLT